MWGETGLRDFGGKVPTVDPRLWEDMSPQPVRSQCKFATPAWAVSEREPRGVWPRRGGGCGEQPRGDGYLAARKGKQFWGFGGFGDEGGERGHTPVTDGPRSAQHV